ncbi:hypothetical protein [Neotabrizicola sp. VNH66]
MRRRPNRPAAKALRRALRHPEATVFAAAAFALALGLSLPVSAALLP